MTIWGVIWRLVLLGLGCAGVGMFVGYYLMYREHHHSRETCALCDRLYRHARQQEYERGRSLLVEFDARIRASEAKLAHLKQQLLELGQ